MPRSTMQDPFLSGRNQQQQDNGLFTKQWAIGGYIIFPAVAAAVMGVVGAVALSSKSGIYQSNIGGNVANAFAGAGAALGLTAIVFYPLARWFASACRQTSQLNRSRSNSDLTTALYRSRVAISNTGTLIAMTGALLFSVVLSDSPNHDVNAFQNAGKRGLMAACFAWGVASCAFHMCVIRSASRLGVSEPRRNQSKVVPRPHSSAAGLFRGASALSGDASALSGDGNLGRHIGSNCSLGDDSGFNGSGRGTPTKPIDVLQRPVSPAAPFSQHAAHSPGANFGSLGAQFVGASDQL